MDQHTSLDDRPSSPTSNRSDANDAEIEFIDSDKTEYQNGRESQHVAEHEVAQKLLTKVDGDAEVPPDPRGDKITLPLAVLITAGSLGMLSFGYELSVLNAPGLIVQQWINQTYADRGYMWRNDSETQANESVLPGVSPSTMRLMYALAVAAFALGGMIGAVSAGSLAERLGRKRSQLLNTTLTLIAAPLIALGGFMYLPELLIGGRFLIGISNGKCSLELSPSVSNCVLNSLKTYTGAATVLGPMYLSECSPRKLRGGIGICNQVGAVLGIFFAQILGLPILLGTETLWPALFLVAALFPAVQLILLFLSPESPRYLYIARNAKVAAGQALKRLRPKEVDINPELNELQREAYDIQKMPKATTGSLFTQRKYLWPLSIAVVMHFSQVLSGINGIIGYSSILFQDAGMTAGAASYANLAIGAIMLVMAFVTLVLIDRLGRKALHLVGMAGVIVFGITVTIFSALPTFIHSDSATNFFQIANISSVFLFLIFFAVGPASIPWMMVVELFGQEARGPANSIACLFNWICQVLTFLGFPLMQSALGAYVYVPHVVLMIIFFAFLWKYMPETNGRTPEQVAAIFERY